MKTTFSWLSSYFLLTGLAISGITFLGEVRPASACTGFWGRMDPTCDHGGITNPVHMTTQDFKICNKTENSISFTLNGSLEAPLRIGYCRTYTNVILPGNVAFDASYADGYQESSYGLDDEKNYSFKLNNQGSGIDLFAD
ncbi:conserved hypothetical protein [Planktothrix agardhii]|uniref:hypothetical protein n=1 Tax=Planktothrix agardhii TaxID=1160 RepID=UPI001B9257F8|nr:hypothetical protein [Planktothrix agardhii]CAD0227018.1 conserved hypothetical protein [Planktothrix agardhii]CAD5957038.1 hypothetical protein NO108_03292 [Planktothrix rubescens]